MHPSGSPFRFKEMCRQIQTDMELVVDAREASLLSDLDGFEYATTSSSLPIGDLLIKNEDRILLLIERKTVSDLVASLRDGRYHQQRKRWLEFMQHDAGVRVALFIEGDLMTAAMDETLRGSLLNSIFRLQTIHHIIVHHVRNRHAFILSLRLLMKKFEKDPDHLLAAAVATAPAVLDLSPYKKTALVDSTVVWQSILSLLPGVSKEMAVKIAAVFPALSDFMNDPDAVARLAEIRISEKRRLGAKQAQRMVELLRPSPPQRQECDGTATSNDDI